MDKETKESSLKSPDSNKTIQTPHPVDLATRHQYERHPYPPIPSLALPSRGKEFRLSYELGAQFAFPESPQVTPSHAGLKILVLGGGTFEPVLVAQTHPLASEVTAVDLSLRSLKILKRRKVWAKAMGRHLAPLRLLQADLMSWEPQEQFDYIMASNVLHHLENPAKGLQRIAKWIKPGGLLRLVTYPKSSRIWMRQTSDFFRRQGLSASTPRLALRCREVISRLDPSDPKRSCFESQPETHPLGGLIDAFFHPCERPLTPLQWFAHAQNSGLKWLGEGQDPLSQSSFLDELTPHQSFLRLMPWEKLQILDDLLEVLSNPVIWFQKKRLEPAQEVPIEDPPFFNPQQEIRFYLKRAERLLIRAGIHLDEVLSQLQKEVGSRVSHPSLEFPEGKPLPGLSILDHLNSN